MTKLNKNQLNEVAMKLRYYSLFEAPTPPILTGKLRASDFHVVDEATQSIYVGHAVPYAKRWHDGRAVESKEEKRSPTDWVKGPVSKKAGNVGDHWIESKIPLILKDIAEKITINILKEATKNG
jgi:hypothetical protein